MEYFLSHLPVLIIAGCIISIAAVIWTILLEKQAKNKRERIKAKQNVTNKDNKNLGE